MFWHFIFATLLSCLLTGAGKCESNQFSPSIILGPSARQQNARSIINLPNFHVVHPFLYRSGAPSPDGLKLLKTMGIKTIIDLRNPKERKFNEKRLATRLGIKYISMPMSAKAPSIQQVHTFIHSAEFAQINGESMLVHCAHGSDRTGCLIGIWRVTHDNWTYNQAYKEMRQYYFGPKFTQLSGAVRKYAKHNVLNETRPRQQ